ncbi:MAG: bifunctional phosphopantothenoylcysteine decarboxylase/phosphopantothenate--cysteine ligase CoaBC [Candidatus Latescibacterota bacterium]|nr:bifunctional phosphopantothenoylcysteine decarboxylase/phosphopantothenate--cysteine ligase CoaBC [Candidatus Latescibacterota bacterium]
MSLQSRKILLGITGGIAAYKAPEIVRQFTACGAEVRVVMTRTACEFVAIKTLEVLSRHPVYTDLFDRDREFSVLHVGLAEWAEVMLVAPATAHFLGRVAGGLADDLLTTLMLSATAPTFLSPSMEEHMLTSGAVEANLQLLTERGYHLLEPETGPLASGASGRGRMPEPAALAAVVAAHFSGDLDGLKLLVSAGPTVEDLDPVRFISNRSSGKMGYAIAQRAAERGAQVWLVAGPTALPVPAGVELHEVRSTLDMQRVVDELFAGVDGAILAAAPVDYRAGTAAEHKIKRCGETLSVELVENPDISAGLGSRKEGRVLVVFAMETEKGLERAREKLARKGGDLIVLNMLRDEGAGFGHDTNRVTMIDAEGGEEALPLLSKLAVADRILDWVRGRRSDQRLTV